MLREFGKAAVAALLVVLLFLSALISGNSDLHGLLHPDHNSPSHYCLISMFEQGHGDMPVAITFVRFTDFVCATAHIADAQAIPAPDRALPNGRGPPCLA
jgi:hypothetical protein